MKNSVEFEQLNTKSEDQVVADEVRRLLDHHENREGGDDFTFFRSESGRKELVDYCKALAEYMHSNEIADLVIIDRSSRPVYIGVMDYWRDMYPDEKMPGIYFMNPKGFKSRDSLTDEELAKV